MASTAVRYPQDRQENYRASNPSPTPADFQSYEDTGPGPYNGGRGRGGRSGRGGRGRGRGAYHSHGQGPAESDLHSEHSAPYPRQTNTEHGATYSQSAGGAEEAAYSKDSQDPAPSHRKSRAQSAARQRPPQRSAPQEAYAQLPAERSGSYDRPASTMRTRDSYHHQGQQDLRRSVKYSDAPALAPGSGYDQREAAKTPPPTQPPAQPPPVVRLSTQLAAPPSIQHPDEPLASPSDRVSPAFLSSDLILLSQAQGKAQADADNAQKRAEEANSKAKEAEMRARRADQRAKDERDRALKTEEVLMDVICRVSNVMASKEKAPSALVAVESAFKSLHEAPLWTEKQRMVVEALGAAAQHADRLVSAETQITQLNAQLSRIKAEATEAKKEYKQAAEMARKAESTFNSHLERIYRLLPRPGGVPV